MVGKTFVLHTSYISGFREVPKGLKVKIVNTNTTTDSVELFYWDYKVKVLNDVANINHLRKGRTVKVDRRTLNEFFTEIKLKNNIKKL